MEMMISFPGRLKFNALFNDSEVKTDQPIQSGLEGRHPTPFSLFISSIGRCTGIYVLKFCKERNIDTENIKLKLKTNWNDELKLIENIDITIETGDDFPEKYHSTLIKVASLCTVKRHLENPPKINISIKNRSNIA